VIRFTLELEKRNESFNSAVRVSVHEDSTGSSAAQIGRATGRIASGSNVREFTPLWTFRD
jgi:hypothetical protein